MIFPKTLSMVHGNTAGETRTELQPPSLAGMGRWSDPQAGRAEESVPTAKAGATVQLGGPCGLGR